VKFLCFFFIALFACTSLSYGQVRDSVTAIKDTTIKPAKISNYGNLLDSSIFLNLNGTPQNLPAVSFKPVSYTWLFYSIAFLFLIFGLIKTYYQLYFDTLIRVLFKTTLKQNQLTDQLEQAKQPSLIFNVLFVALAGIYIFTLLDFIKNKRIEVENIKIRYMVLCMLIVGACYSVKYISLLLVGWLTDLKQEMKSYIFIVFLLNKVLGIFLLILLPFIIFGSSSLSSFAVLISIVAVVLSFLLRYARTFSQLKSKFSVNAALFLLLIICLEVMPLAIIFKFCSIYSNTKA
jgi:Domain of unknown function (DUF4271)